MQAPQRPPLISLWDLLALMGFGGLWVYYLQVVPSLPERVPTHFNAAGVANGWTPKGDLAIVIFGIPLVIWGIVTLQAIIMSARELDPARADAISMRPLRGLLGVGLAFLMAMCLQAALSGPWTVILGVLVLLALTVIGIALMIRAFAKVNRDRSALQYYKLGLFYVNPHDPRVWIPKPVGVGYTLNFSRTGSWLFLLLIFGVLAVTVGIVKNLT